MNTRFGVMINSWNVQGNSKGKIRYLAPLISKIYGNILVLQEEGVPGSTGFATNDTVKIGSTEFICLLAQIDMTAKNERCSIAVLVERGLRQHVEIVGCYTSAVQRFLCYIDLKAGVRIATVHATANASIAIWEVKEYIEWLDGNSPSNGWILTGDFNSTPGDYPIYIPGNPIVLSPNVSQPIPYKATSAEDIYFCNLLFDANPTQGANGVRRNYYDFTFYQDKHNFLVSGIRNRMVLTCRNDGCMDFMCPICTGMGNYISDHNLIQTLVFL